MDSFEFNKIAGAVLGSFLFVLALQNVPTILAGEHKEEGPKAYVIEVPDAAPAAAEGGAPAAAGPAPIGPLLAAATPAAGEGIFKQRCTSCHDATKGGPNKTGPDLWGVVDRPIGSHEGFAYSAGVKGHGGNWTVDNLNHWIADPKAFIGGNKMAFAGLRKPEDRANLIVWLNQQSDTPKSVEQLTAEAGGPAGAASGETPPAAPASPAPATPPAQ